MSSGQIQRHGVGILSAVERGLAISEELLPRFPRSGKKEVPERVKERLKNLKLWREQYCVELGLDPGVLAPNWLLEAIADTQCATKDELDAIPGMREWQKQLYGAELARIPALV
jgi:ribonuclease D